ncbi:hypothetical protein [Deinococcus soli (ex Cha et al. 2016)]|uniref:Uncharacterized protein n=2 Tax=Deinococcus soli (ex Cha et al. 2016) TaxID=1309411 RepID=A0ACC6KGS1_9DEIO|nr:hypothetical protein [Deinococcus soli (ex Cha et al. 2016)]MDR6218954.1 hypothetical protein [Deinococcus soli (ex Cha et al. 2016)]MDR6328751.1 hypothetical protein [Deinococcus soli (ex Cha et al. 2016)]MDR6751762.1 hypothetical protein [Deinococcus soli (ex Cha et al. 2016)]
MPAAEPWKAAAYSAKYAAAVDRILGTYGTEDAAIAAAEAHLRARPARAILVDITYGAGTLPVKTLGWIGGTLECRDRPEHRPEFTQGPQESWTDFKRRTWAATQVSR